MSPQQPICCSPSPHATRCAHHTTGATTGRTSPVGYDNLGKEGVSHHAKNARRAYNAMTMRSPSPSMRRFDPNALTHSMSEAGGRNTHNIPSRPCLFHAPRTRTVLQFVMHMTMRLPARTRPRFRLCFRKASHRLRLTAHSSRHPRACTSAKRGAPVSTQV